MITIIDYNMGNLHSVSKALEHLGGKVRISSKPEEILSSDKLILPGVGAFGDGCREMQSANVWEPILEFVKTGKPFLGICLGLQLLFEESEETPGVPGLGIFSGKVQRFRSKTVKVPHMGWNTASLKNSPPLKGLPNPAYFYFVHSFYAVPKDPSIVLAETEYGGEKFPAIVGQGNVFATQFHPEKSQDAGLQILRNFLTL